MAMKPSETKVFFLTRIEPVKVKKELYGKQVEFNSEKKHVKFHSAFHPPTHIQFTQIEKMEVEYDKRKKLLWVGLCTFILFFGFFILIIRMRLPPWKVKLVLKHNAKPIIIRTRIDEYESQFLTEFCNPYFPTLLTPKHPEKDIS